MKKSKFNNNPTWILNHKGGCHGKPINIGIPNKLRCENPQCSYAGEGNPENKPSQDYSPPQLTDDDVPF